MIKSCFCSRPVARCLEDLNPLRLASLICPLVGPLCRYRLTYKKPFARSSCPFDYVTIYDGPDKMAPKIGTYCGQMRNLVIYSTKNTLFLTFTTLKRTAIAQNRGFFGLFEFSESFVKLGKIRKLRVRSRM